jgi:hypothetical protein
MAAKTKTEKLRGEFEGKYGAPKDPSKRVLIGMKSGKAVYGDEWDEVTPMENEITNTYSQNQEELRRVGQEMKRSGGMYNPSPNDITRMENKYPSDAKDTQSSIPRVGASPMIGSDSPAAISMRENPTQDAANARFLATLKRNAADRQAQRNQEVKTPSTIAAPSIQREPYPTKKPAAAPAVTPAAAPAAAPAAVPAVTPASSSTRNANEQRVAADYGFDNPVSGYPMQKYTPSRLDLITDSFLNEAGFGSLYKKSKK